MVSFWKHVNGVLRQADLIIEVLDSRMIEESRNYEIEEKIKRSGKQILYVINKCDLVDAQALTPWKKILNPCIFISSRYHLGTTLLKKKILEISKGEQVIVGVVGYPNVGKSSLINVLKQKKSAGTASVAGFTRGLQKIKIDTGIYLLDTPGVIPYKEKDDIKHAMINIKHPSKIEDPEFIAEDILIIAIEKNPKLVETLYKIKLKEGEEIPELLGRIALNFKWLKKGGLPNIDLISRKIIEDWQRGRLII